MNSGSTGYIAVLLLACSLAAVGCTCGRDGATPGDSSAVGADDGASGRESPMGGSHGEDNEHDVIGVPEIPGPDGASVVITTGLRGYTEPCGCSVSLQLGGIDRLAHVVGELTSRGPSVVLDAGDMFFQTPDLPDATRAQELARAEVIADAARHIDVRWTVPGSYDLVDGTDTYRRLVERAEIKVISTNGTASFLESLNAVTHARVSIDGWELLVVGLTDPDTMPEGRANDFRGVEPSLKELRASLDGQSWDAAIVLFQGTAQAAQTLLRTSDALSFDFVVVGKNTRPGSHLLNIADSHGVEVFDQAREVGSLRLVGEPERQSMPRWTPIGRESDNERAAITEQLERTEAQVVLLRERLEGRESRLLTRMEDRIDGYREELAELDTGGSEPASAPADRNAFLWHTIEIIPQFARDADVAALRVAFNESLRELNLAHAPPPPPVADGAPRFVGGDTCKGCHQPAHAFWETTAHGTAIDTLVVRDKRYDTSCVGCHVTGFNMPGGSSLGHLDGLEDVQCESCHGPGSAHAANPTDVSADINVSLQVETSTCQSCHTPEHSPEFEDAAYRALILGSGHGDRSVE